MPGRILNLHDLGPDEELMEKVLAAFPRLDMKQGVTDCFSRIVKTKPDTTNDNFLRDFGERFVPRYKVPSVVTH